MSSARAVSDTFQSCSRSFASRNARSAACLNSSNVLQSAQRAQPAWSPTPRAPEQAVDVGRRHARAGRQDQQPLDRVAQLAHVARPVERRQPLDRRPRRSRAAPRRRCRARLRHEVRDQQRNVLAPLAQRRHVDRHDVQAVEEVLAEPARRRSPSSRFLFVAAITRTSTSTRLRAADARHDAVLQHAQHLRLRGERHVADLVEEERAAVGLLELARPVRRSRR